MSFLRFGAARRFAKTLFTLPGLSVLAACQSGPAGIAPASVTRTGLVSDELYIAPWSGHPGQYLIFRNGWNLAYVPNGVPNNQYFTTYTSNALSSDFAILGQSPSGDGEVYVTMLNGNLLDEMKRLQPTTFPTNPAPGSASYSGSYMGIYTNEAWVAPGFEATGHILGTVALNVDLGAATIDGLVSNRQNTGGTTLGDIVINSTTISDGAFLASTSGGAFNLPGFTVTPFSAGGLLVGPDGSEIVGLVGMRHFGPNSPTQIFDEFGGFVAVKN